jgi:alanine racemase
MHSLNRRAWVDIDLGALLRNATAIATRSNARLLPMIKADAYGLGAVRVARALERLDPWGFGVATIIEGEELRRAGIVRPIIVFSPLLVGEFDAAVRADLTPALGDYDSIERWQSTGRPWHLAIDTGMSRAGVPWNETEPLRDLLPLHAPQGVFTHFHSAERNDESRTEQERRFSAALDTLPIRAELIHAENSGAVEHCAPSPWDLVRPGIFLYGVSSGNSPEILPEPVVNLHSRIVEVRTVPDGDTVSYDATFRAIGDRRIATLSIGYADGYPRAMSNRSYVLLNGRRAPVAGLVTMDMTMIDVTDVPCSVGDAATLIGTDGDERISVAELAAMGDMSPYELLTGLRGRLVRRYIEENV